MGQRRENPDPSERRFGGRSLMGKRGCFHMSNCKGNPSRSGYGYNEKECTVPKTPPSHSNFEKHRLDKLSIIKRKKNDEI